MNILESIYSVLSKQFDKEVPIYPGVNAAAKDYDEYIVYAAAGQAEESTLNPNSSIFMKSIVVTAWSNTYRGSKVNAGKILKAFDKLLLVTGVISCVLVDRRDVVLEDQGSTVVYGDSCTFNIKMC